MKEKAAYLKGLIDGLGIDENTKEGKVIKAMSELLSEMAETVDSIDEDVTPRFMTRLGHLAKSWKTLKQTCTKTKMPRTKRTTLTTRPRQTTMTTTPTWPVSLIMRWPALPAARPST